MNNYPLSTIREIQWWDDYYRWHGIPKPHLPIDRKPGNRIRTICTIVYPTDEGRHICGNPKYIRGDSERDDLEANLVSALGKILEQRIEN